MLGLASEVEERFWAKVVRDPETDCWLWTASTDNGYGRFWVAGRLVLAHRFAYELLVGPIPEGLELDHLCRVRHCVNPAHMEPVTQRVNILRGVGFSAKNAAKTHCKRGHALDEANTYRRGDGKRHCRACNARRDRERQARIGGRG